MAQVPRFVQLRRVAPGIWTLAAWVLATGLALWIAPTTYVSTAVPRDGLPPVPGSGFHEVGARSQLLILLGATLAMVAGSALLRRIPLAALACLLAGAAAGSLVFHTPLTQVLEFLPTD